MMSCPEPRTSIGPGDTWMGYVIVYEPDAVFHSMESRC